MWPRVFSRPISGLKVNTLICHEISMCTTFFPAMLPFYGIKGNHVKVEIV